MNDLMLDIETLGTNSNSVVLQVSMVYFDRYTKEIGKTFTQNIDIEDSFRLGFYADEETVKWWENKPKEIWESVSTNGFKVTEVIKNIEEFVDFKTIIWSHSSFDIPLLENIFRKLNKKIPWKYTNTRDIRTLVDLSGIDLKSYNWNKGKTHNSLDDCMFQINYVVDAFNKLKGIKGNGISEPNNIKRLIV